MKSSKALNQLKWLAIFLAAFFTASGFGEYYFVKRQLNRTLLGELSRASTQIDKAVNYPTGVTVFGAYNKAFIDSRNYFVVLSDGYLFDNGAGAERIPPGLLPEVTFTGDESTLYARPLPYASPLGERWHLMAKRLTDGRVILGLSALDTFVDPDSMILANAKYFNGTVRDASSVSRNKLDNNLHYAVIDDQGVLIAGDGRLPLRTNPLVLGGLGFGASERNMGGTDYLLWTQPILDESRKIAGTVITFRDVTLENRILDENLLFSTAAAAISWLVLFLFGSHYWSRKESEKRMLREGFQHYFSPQVLEAILKEPGKLKLGGERREVTILFSDIRSFTALTENLPPHTLTTLLHEYFAEMTDAVQATDGIVDKYIGDAIMAFWGAPIPQHDQADRAVTTAIDMMRRLRKLRQGWKQRGYPELDIGIGISLGVATVGNFGSAKRFDYTAIGDVVNTASRIEALNKRYQCNIIISESARNQLTLPFETTNLGEIQVAGKEKSIRVFRVECDDLPAACAA